MRGIQKIILDTGGKIVDSPLKGRNMRQTMESIEAVIPSKLFFKFGIFCILSIVVVGCATTRSKEGMKIQEADEATVINCKYAGDVHGSSGWGNLAASTGIQNAKNEGMEMAARLGASHVVWTTVTGGYSPFVSGRAYLCK